MLAKLEPLREAFDVEQYGALSQDPDRYPLYVIKTKRWDQTKPSALVTGGVHGYETSGVQGALEFAATKMASCRGRVALTDFSWRPSTLAEASYSKLVVL